MSLGHQNSILEWILKDRVALKSRVMMQKIQLCHQKNNYILKYIKLEIVVICHKTKFLAKATLIRIRDFFPKIKKPKLLNGSVLPLTFHLLMPKKLKRYGKLPPWNQLLIFFN